LELYPDLGEEPEPEYLKDKLCPKCGSRLRVDRVAGIAWCSSMLCDHWEELV